MYASINRMVERWMLQWAGLLPREGTDCDLVTYFSFKTVLGDACLEGQEIDGIHMFVSI